MFKCIFSCFIQSGNSKDQWSPALIVTPSASNRKIDTKEEYLIRSFKDGRYYTISKKDITRFHRDAIKKTDNAQLKEGDFAAVTSDIS